MKYQEIKAFTGVKKDVHPRALPDDKLYDARNVYFKNGKTYIRPGYTQLGTNLPLSGAMLNLSEYTKLRTPGRDLLAITDNSIYQYDSTTDVWDETANIYNTGTVNQPDTEVEFNAAASTYICSCKLDDTHWAVAYRDNGDSGHGKVAMGTLVAGLASYDTAVEFNGGATTHISICCLGVDDDTTPTVAYIVVAYADTTTTYGTCIAGTVTLADGTITYGSELAFNAYATTYTSIISSGLDTTTSPTYGYFTVAFAANSKGSAVSSIVTLATNTIAAYGTVTDFNATAVTYVSMCALDTTHIVVAYRDNDTYGKAHMGVVTLATKVIDFATYSEYSFDNNVAGIKYASIIMIDTTHVAIAWNNIVNLVETIATINISNGLITYGINCNINSNTGGTTIRLDKFDSTNLIVTYCDEDVITKGNFCISSILSTTITKGDIYNFNSDDTNYTHIIVLTPSSFIVSFEDGGDSNHGTSMYYDRLGFTGDGTTWGTTWPDATYDIKFGTNSLTGTGTPDVWYKIHQPESTTYLVLSDDTLLDYLVNTLKLLSTGTNYIIRRSFVASNTDYYDTANILEDISTSGESQLLLANYVDPIMLYNGSTLADLDMTASSGGTGTYTAPIDSAKYAEYYHDLIVLAYCIDGSNPMPQSVYWNDRGHPTYWATGTAGYADLTQNNDYITGMMVFNQRLYIWKEKSIVECYYTGQVDPALEFTEDKVNGIGQPHGRTLINIGNAILFKGEDNIYSFTGYQPTPIGNEIITHLRDNELEAYKDAAFAFQLKKEFLYCLAVVTSGTTPNMIYALNYMTGSWSIWQFHDNVTCFGYYGDNIVLGDEDGYIYLVDYNIFRDGSWKILDTINQVAYQGLGYGNGVWIAIATSGTNRIMRSTDDGLTWTAIAAPEDNSWYNIAYGDGVWICVAITGTNRIMRSTDDGLTWTAIAAPEANPWYTIKYGNEVWISTALSGTNRIMRSTDDGLTWTAIAAPEANPWYGLDYGNNIWIGVSYSGTNRIMRSTDDGLTWTAIAAPENNIWYNIAYGNRVWIATSVDGTNRIMRSTDDGLTWTAIAIELSTWRGVVYGNEIWTTIANSGTNRIAQSTDDGLTWTAIAAPEDNTWIVLAYGNGVWIALAQVGLHRLMRLNYNIIAYIETKDYPLNDFKHLFRLLETSIILEDQVTSTIQISYSIDFGTTWSTPVVVNQNVTENVYDHVQNHFGTGKQVRFKLENVTGSKFALEGLVVGFEDIGISIKR
jgi:photosystem II stability/assembly factor-like uncharacterized protein